MTLAAGSFLHAAGTTHMADGAGGLREAGAATAEPLGAPVIQAVVMAHAVQRL